MSPFSSLKTKLFVWYSISLFLMALFVMLVIHVFALKNGVYFLVLLFLTLAVLGLTIIYNITKSLTYLATRMKTISSKNLDERIEGLESSDEIGELAGSFNDLLNRLHASFKREQQFIADVAHELKTPLSTLQGSLEVALNKKRTVEEYRALIRDSLVETHNLSSTLKNVLDLAWLEAPLEQKNAKKFDFSMLLDELCETAQKMGMRKKIKVVASIEKNISIQGFRDKLGRALLNIVDNAIKYTPARGKVNISLKRKREDVMITIIDTGQGISSLDLPHIFDRFYRGGATENVFGSGLGLAITKAIITSHQGKIEVKSAAAKGTSLRITLPLNT